MSNILSKTNATLEERLRILSNPNLTGDKLQEQLLINKAITETSKEITNISRLALDATKLEIDYGNKGFVSKDLIDVNQLEVSHKIGEGNG